MRRFIAILLVLLCAVCCGCAATEEEGGVRLTALNVGKGDCLLLTVDGQSYLIDAGYDYTAGRMLEALRQYGVDWLGGVFLTHCDKDHAGGLMALANSGVRVDAWYAAAIYYDVKDGQHPAELAAAARGDTVRFLNAGDTLTLGESATLRVLGPLTVNTENENNNSLVFSVETGDGTLLFTGDMKLEEEYALLEAGLIPQAELLKVPFHGDNTASSAAFVEAVSPAAAVISTSTAEEPDTPASSVLKRYGKLGADVYVTQDYRYGLELTLQKGRVRAKALAWDLPDHSKTVRAEITPEEDLLTLYNTGSSDISLAGWTVFSTKGEECVTLPEDAALPAGGSWSLGTRATKTEADGTADIKRLWHKSKYDEARVYDAAGNPVAVTDNGRGE